MEVIVLHETDHELALRGMAYSFKDRALNPEEWWPNQKERALKRAPLLAPMDEGHNKFLRQIFLFLDIEAPRSFWSEFDTYKVGTVANSESTMHTLGKRPPTENDFEKGTSSRMIEAFTMEWVDYQIHKDITRLKENLPEGFLQRRLVTMNYDNIRNIISQRENHRYKRWGEFIEQLLPQLAHPEYLKKKS